MARLPDAAQDRLHVPRLDPRRPVGPRLVSVPRPGPAGRARRHPGVAELLLQVPAGRTRPLSRARPVHPADQAPEHAPLDDGRGADHAPRDGLLPRRVAVRRARLSARAGARPATWLTNAIVWPFPPHAGRVGARPGAWARGGVDMELTLPAGPEIDQGTAKEVREGGRELSRSLLGLAAVKALDLSDQATEKSQQLARRRRRKYRRTANKQARKLEKRLTTAAKRLHLAMPIEKRRRRGRRRRRISGLAFTPGAGAG